ncbi:MAG: RNA methyltransferase [Clostridia bacterium]|nr:RNA methyltransferase [Clostridia bacterium]
MIITSRENKIFKTAKLIKSAKGRSEKGLFLIEGLRSVRDAAQKKARFFCIITKEETKLDFTCDCPVYAFAPKLFCEISETVTPQGVIALCYMEKKELKDIINENKNCAIMCECLQDPGNIGTVVRTAHAANCGGVVLTNGSCDLYNPKIIRATMSGVFSVPVVQNAESRQVIEYFRSNGYKIVAGALSEDAVDFYSSDLSGKVLIIIGNEGSGVTGKTLSLCDSVLKIPMRSDAESLNAAVAGAVMIYECYRQNSKNL